LRSVPDPACRCDAAGRVGTIVAARCRSRPLDSGRTADQRALPQLRHHIRRATPRMADHDQATVAVAYRQGCAVAGTGAVHRAYAAPPLARPMRGADRLGDLLGPHAEAPPMIGDAVRWSIMAARHR